MPLLRVNRAGAGSARKLPKANRKKRLSKKEWDDTVHDLTIHRATPEDIVRRHEMHKSKNKMLVHLEMQEKALKSKIKKQRTPESLRKKKLSLMREILSDQYQLQEVLERSDQTMAMVKDLFGDAPRRRLGFPNVTIAPDSASFQSPIVQKGDPPTQLSILSESVMDAQALNEVEGTSLSKTGGEKKVYLALKSNINNDRIFEETSVVSCQQESDKQQLPTTSQDEVNFLSTPTNVQPLGHSALNATNIVRKVQSRLQNEEQTPDVTYVVQNVLNANVRKQNQTSVKVKKRQSTQACGAQKGNPNTSGTSFDVPSRSKSNLEVLNQIVQDMEHEMEEFEKWMGLDVQEAYRDQGVSGFTHSLVNTMCRILRCLKETETKLQQEKMKRQHLERELSEHRALIDALTAEVLLVRKENLSMQDEFQQYLTMADQQIISLTQTFKEFPVTEIQTTSPGETEERLLKTPKEPQGKPLSDSVEPKMDKPELAQVDFPSKNPVLLNPPDRTYSASMLSSCVFQPAVLLSPPQQKSSQAMLPFQDEPVGRESAGEQRSCVSHKPLVKQEDSSLLTQRSSLSVTPQTSSILANTSSALPRPDSNSSAEELTSGVLKKCAQSDELQGQIAELTAQNSLLKAQLSKFSQCCQGTKRCVQEPSTVLEGSAAEGQGCSPGVNNLKELPKSLEERIAELNRQSEEARNKLLLLTNQQKLPTFISVSPPVSPIPSPSANQLENGRRMIEVSIPVAEILDSSKENTPSPATGTNGTRSICNQTFSPPNTSMGNIQLMYNRKMTEKQREGGWFALSAHIV